MFDKNLNYRVTKLKKGFSNNIQTFNYITNTEEMTEALSDLLRDLSCVRNRKLLEEWILDNKDSINGLLSTERGILMGVIQQMIEKPM